jgi:hypothetical protein
VDIEDDAVGSLRSAESGRLKFGHISRCATAGGRPRRKTR